MDILRKSMAPISDKAWEEINETAVDVLTASLSGRKFMDVEGPKGMDYAALPTGRLDVPANQKNPVKYGIHKVLPLVETRIPFELNIWELDNAARGAADIDLEPLEVAAREIAKFEEHAIYEGFKPGNITGLKNSSDYPAIPFPDKSEDILGAVSQGISRMKEAAIEGPYSLVLNTSRWQQVNAFLKGYPLRRQLDNLLGGKIIHAPHVKDAYLVTERGGDYRLVLGQDISIGYESHSSKTVQLFFTSSFTFQAIDPAAVVIMK